MVIIKGEVRKGKMIQGIQHTFVDLSVDELCRENTPYTNFFVFCLLNNLLTKDPEDQSKFIPNIHLVELEESKDEEKNQIVYKMFDKLEVRYF